MKTKITGIKKKSVFTDTKIASAIQNTEEVEIDALWAILKYKEIGILRKVMCICHILNIDSKEILEEIPQDENGRFLDKPTRNMIHNALIKRIEYETNQ
jgi:hypothetical protein